MSDANQVDQQLQVRNLFMGFIVSRALQVAAELGLADALVDGPKHRDALAREVGAHADTMNRLMRALASLSVCTRAVTGRRAGPLFAATSSLYDWARGPAYIRGLVYSVRAGCP